MLRRASWILLLSASVCGQLRAAEVLPIGPEDGSIDFVGSKDDGSHRGGFKKFSGSVKLDPDELTSTEVEVRIETGSLWSDHPKLTAHLLNQDFFHADKFPRAVFRSTELRAAKAKEKKTPDSRAVTHVLTGALTLLSVRQEVVLPVTIELSDEAFAIRGKYSLDRTRFGMDYGIGKIHKDVVVDFSLKLPRKSRG